jgi:hypothetical protein
VVLFGLCLLGNFVRDEGDRPRENESPLRVSAAEVKAEYDDNEARADARFKGRLLEVTGVAIYISDDSVVLGEGHFFELTGVQCQFRRPAQLIPLRKGQAVTVVGRCRGKTINVFLEDCTLGN